ncbi:MAG TPA: dTDP-4-dehydrorhamnose reductase, partial [Thermomicrobiales bacterium]|nr:dTDP-4-dehydrorhamnose reductase [Thermomicrobiales bacterium]
NGLRGQRVAVTGAAGQVGEYLCWALEAAGADVWRLGHHPGAGIDTAFDLTSAEAVRKRIVGCRPDVVIHAAAYTDVDGAERDPNLAMAVNGAGSAHVAAAAKEVGAWLLGVGTDFVFPGSGGAPYGEDAAPNPINAYGRSKLAGEQAILAADPSFAVARTAWVYGGPGRHFPRTLLRLLRDRDAVEVVDDETSCPTYASDLAEALTALAIARGAGVFHLVNEGQATRYALAREVARAAGLDPDVVHATTTADFLRKTPLPARRPPNSALRNERAAALGIRLRPWNEAVAAYVPKLAKEMRIARAVAASGGE